MNPLRQILLAIAIAWYATTATAHFPWLSTDPQGHAILWFGEDLADKTYHMPDAIAKSNVQCGDARCEIKPIDTDHLIGMRSVKAVDPVRELNATAVYGNYHGTKLTYFVEHLPHKDSANWPTKPRKDAVLQTIVMPPANRKLTVLVLHNGKPLPDTEVKLFDSQGEQSATTKTNDAGKVEFAIDDLSIGLNALMVGYENKKSGKHNGKPFTSESFYLTSTLFHESKKPAKEKKAITIDPKSQSKIVPAGLPDLPEELTSFGAAVLNNTVYVYGGHTGTAHSYSTAEQSDRFWALDLSGGENSKWTKLPSGPRLQGLMLVAVGEKVLRIGGFTAMNAEGEEQDLRSQVEVAAFDPKSSVWTQLPSLPEPRSSFDAVAVGDTVYIAGGWSMNGDQETVWHQTAWSLDTSKADAKWQLIADPPFQRRAISMAELDGQLYVIGGMQKTAGPTTKVDIYDLKTKTWTPGPALPGSGMSGFGTAAFSAAGKLYVSAMDGYVHELSSGSDTWRTIAQQKPSRFFHRMIPIAKDKMILLGGANMEMGKFTNLEVLQIR